MDKIYDTDSKFQFDKLALVKPISQNGSYFIKYSIQDFPLYIRPPKAVVKQIVKGAKKSHCDFIFSQENEEFIQWMENLENHSQQTIFKHREQWFESGLELEDIENSFTSPMKTYKSGKFYIVRTNISQRLGKVGVKIYNENEEDLLLDDISGNMNVMTILEIQGIKCSSKSFQIEIELKQMMVLNPIDLFEKCILNKKKDVGLKKIDTEDLGKIAQNTLDNLSQMDNTNENIVLEKVEEKKMIEEKNGENDLEKTTEKESVEQTKPENINELCEIDFNLEEMSETDTFTLKQRDDVYYEMYREARRKAKLAKDIALSAYLEAKQIKNKYMLDDISDSDDSDLEFDENEDENENEK